MTEQVQKKRTPRKKPQLEAEVQPKKSGEELKAEMDEILDEIDGVLEENAQEFVRAYVQKGGE